MISANDATILAMLSRFPDMSNEEAEEYISRIENEQNVPICYAVLGRIDSEQLDESARQIFADFQRWSQDRTLRTRNEEWNARRRRKETRTALNLNKLHRLGKISDQVLLMYGISGSMPERSEYMSMPPEERERMWAIRMENRFGPNWLNRFNQATTRLPIFPKVTHFEQPHVNWRHEGF